MPLEPAELKKLVVRIMDENRTMALATLRPDGWPQATIVGFVRDDLTLYFAISRASQKLANIRGDPRVAIAIGHPEAGQRGVRGLSLAAHASEVPDWREVARLNELIRTRYPEVAVFAPRDNNAAVMKAEPIIVSLVDDGEGLKEPVLLRVTKQAELHPTDTAI